MNRAEQRRQQKAQKTKTYTLTDKEITKIKQDAVNEAIVSVNEKIKDIEENAVKQSFLMMLTIPLWILHDKYGFGKKRLSDFMEMVLLQYDWVQDGEISFNDLIDTLERETGVKLIYE